MDVSQILAFISAAVGAAFALGAALYAGRSLPRWAFAGAMAALALDRLCCALAAHTVILARQTQWRQYELAAAAFMTAAWLLFSLVYSRGNAWEFLARWKYALIAALALPVVAAAFFRRELIVFTVAPGPQNLPVVQLAWLGGAMRVLVLVGAVLVLTNLERTFRAASGIMRWRVKFMLLGVGLIFATRLYTASQALLFRGFASSLEIIDSTALLVAAPLLLRSLLRTRRTEIEVYPSRSVIQGSIAILLAGTYLVIIGVFAGIVARLGGDASFALKALGIFVAIVVLAVLLQSDRVRLRLRQFVSRHFRRPMYDYRTVWRTYTEGTASRVDQTDLCRALVKLTADTFNVLSVTLWLVDEGKEGLLLAASTAQSEPHGREAESPSGARGVIAHFQLHPEPVDCETSPEPWAVTLREWHPTMFPNYGGHRVCLPLVGRGELLGLITLGDRVGGLAFSLQDFDMLKCIGDHIAASLLNIQLSRRLLQAKEVEAFQTMATFFVHDLKNAASTLNLMFQNLPEHFDDPAFREDALRGVSKSVAHINHLVERLTTLRHETKIRPHEADLNELVGRILDGLDPGANGGVARELSPLPKVQLDLDQAAKVVTNLVLNARDAVAANGGEVRVATGLSGAWAVLTVADTGCGMSPEFLRRSLFRPFQTTKKNGLGIGMFQSKTIVEAHGGRVEVESEPGKGTTFRVFWPVSKA